MDLVRHPVNTLMLGEQDMVPMRQSQGLLASVLPGLEACATVLTRLVYRKVPLLTLHLHFPVFVIISAIVLNIHPI